MGRLLSVLATAAFALSIVAGGCAKEKAPSSPEPAKKESAAIVTKTAPKSGAKLFTGTIEVLDASAGTLTLKGPRGERRFQVHGKLKEQLDGLEIGDKVIVKHTDEMVLSIVKPGANKNVQTSEEKESPLKGKGSMPHSEKK